MHDAHVVPNTLQHRNSFYYTRPPKFFSVPGEKCSLPGCDKPRFVDPASGRVHDYCGITHANQAIKSGGERLFIATSAALSTC
jgi:hypothetical protein